MVNCDDESVIKVMPNSWVEITKNCDMIGSVCHNTTEVLKPLLISTILLHGSVQIYNFTNRANCKELKKIKNQDIIKGTMRANGLRDCDEMRAGVRCVNGTFLKFTGARRLVQMVSHLARVGDKFGSSTNIYFEGGKKSCMNFSFVAKK